MIRKATLKDIPRILELDKEANKEVKWWEPLRNSDVKKLLKQKNLLYVAKNKKEIIGFLTAGIKKYCVELEDIFVKKEFRKKDVAKNLVKAFIFDWKKSKFKEIHLMCPLRLKKFYERLGFRPSMLLMKYNKK